ncbi:sugar phosphate isomerase/epimerase family protein [Breznakiella homolactica]|uniref:Sugar phosphate isomerase/epimerase n=1 Tax=Breznakiella homolactica TaxID=2798577 RepID=A0A7T7XQZ0_9SPIR|nr:sugar phosphate isomerase/epimerase family protein [Breznakiella homolactica]QQO10822.1 sugar phosphate isomerase/epimerase [Breznakiella homolactica]
MVQIGLRAHDFGKTTPELLAESLVSFRPASIQLAFAKALVNPPQVPGGLSHGYANYIRSVFEKQNIRIAVLGCYINPVHPDADIRNRMLLSFEEHLRFARDFNCPLVGTETGSCNPDCSWHPDTEKPATFDLFCRSIERLLTAAEKCGSIVGVEAVAGQHTISSVELMEKLIEKMASPALKVIYDPVNLIPETGLAESQEAFFSKAFSAFGKHITAIHSKDFRMEKGRKTGTFPTGTGQMDYKSFLKILLQQKPGIDILLENSSPAAAAESMRFLRETEAQVLL